MSETTAAQHPVFNLEKLYVKDLSLEVPDAPAVFLEQENPRIDFGLTSEAAPIGENRFEVVITVTVHAKLKEKTVFLIEAKQAGIFEILNIPQDEMEQVLSVVCPNMLFPYLRQTVSDMSVRAGFPPVLLSPLNFEVLYHQQKHQKLSQLPEQQAPVTTH